MREVRGYVIFHWKIERESDGKKWEKIEKRHNTHLATGPLNDCRVDAEAGEP